MKLVTLTDQNFTSLKCQKQKTYDLLWRIYTFIIITLGETKKKLVPISKGSAYCGQCAIFLAGFGTIIDRLKLPGSYKSLLTLMWLQYFSIKEKFEILHFSNLKV